MERVSEKSREVEVTGTRKLMRAHHTGAPIPPQGGGLQGVEQMWEREAVGAAVYHTSPTLAVEPTVHPQLLDVLLKFRTHKVALTTDKSKNLKRRNE